MRGWADETLHVVTDSGKSANLREKKCDTSQDQKCNMANLSPQDPSPLQVVGIRWRDNEDGNGPPITPGHVWMRPEKESYLWCTCHMCMRDRELCCAQLRESCQWGTHERELWCMCKRAIGQVKSVDDQWSRQSHCEAICVSWHHHYGLWPSGGPWLVFISHNIFHLIY